MSICSTLGSAVKGEVDDDEVDRFDPVLGEIGAMRRVRHVGKDAAVDLGMEGHGAVAEDRRKPGDVSDVGHRHAAGGNLPGGPTAR